MSPAAPFQQTAAPLSVQVTALSTPGAPLVSRTPYWRAPRAPLGADAQEQSATRATTYPMTPVVDSPKPAPQITATVSIRFFPRMASPTTADRLQLLR